MQVIYNNELPRKDEYYALFETTGWNEEYQFDQEQLYAATRQCWYLVSAYDQDRLVGFGRIISDGVLHALIVELIVLPEYKGKGIGSTILKKLVERCRNNNIHDIQLFCARGQAGFYEKYGFLRRPAEQPGMQIPKIINGKPVF